MQQTWQLCTLYVDVVLHARCTMYLQGVDDMVGVIGENLTQLQEALDPANPNNLWFTLQDVHDGAQVYLTNVYIYILRIIAQTTLWFNAFLT